VTVHGHTYGDADDGTEDAERGGRALRQDRLRGTAKSGKEVDTAGQEQDDCRDEEPDG
jgi:hypothetical protein